MFIVTSNMRSALADGFWRTLFAKRVPVSTESKRGHQNWVNSSTLSQLEQHCEQYCYVPRVPPQKVSVIGAGSDIGKMASLFLKQQNVVKILAMHDEWPSRNVIGAAHDISHIDTSTAVEGYQGRPYLKDAIHDSDVVLICGGYYPGPPVCHMLDRELFCYNQSFVRNACMSVAKFAPYAIIVIQTPPVDCNFALCKHTLEEFRVYDKRRLLGCNAISAMRANQLYCNIANLDPMEYWTPVVGGTGRCTRVPVFSELKDYVCQDKEKIDYITRLVREADELICRVKSNFEQAHLSIGFSTARFVTQVMKGLFEKPSQIDSALVEQDSPEQCFGMEVCATPLQIGKGGIVEYQIPKLNAKEQSMLDECKCDLEDMLELGRCYAVGDDYCIHPGKFFPCEPVPICKSCNAP